MKDFTLNAHISKELDLAERDCYEECFSDSLRGARLLWEKTPSVGQLSGHMRCWHGPPDLCQHGGHSGSTPALSAHGPLLRTPEAMVLRWAWVLHARARKDHPPPVFSLPPLF